ncbi:MAG TPA: ABC transporter ATP-binding protein [Xanthomonadales bacterium]|nr:ABC transporter ATP-binding protein [Xanthomonadales bacterium]
MSEIAISARGLSKNFGPVEAVRELDIDVPKAQIYGFLGPNGSGKSTTIRMLCGLLTPSDGEIQVLGLDIPKQAEQLKLDIGYMTQKFSLYADLTARENLGFMSEIYSLDSKRAKQRINDVVERYELGHLLGQFAGTLSGGQKQRLALAACTLHEPRLLLLDEPTSAVDPENRRAFWESLFELVDEGTTILVSTHYMDEAERCHALAILDEGCLVAAGTPDELSRGIDAQVLLLHSSSPRAISKFLFPDHSEGAASHVSPAASFVHSSAQIGNTLRVMVERDLEQAEEKLASVLTSAGLPVESCERVSPSLEDVFVAATQERKRHRDEEPETNTAETA